MKPFPHERRRSVGPGRIRARFAPCPWRRVLAAACLAVVAARASAAEEPSADAAWVALLQEATDSMEWSDELVRHDWRLQHRPGTDDFRILDPQDKPVRAGTRNACLDTFASLGRSGTIPEVCGPTVIVLHGLGEGRGSMRPLVEHLRSELDATVLSFGYASTRTGIADHGRSLAAVIAGLPKADRISFVGHSLGGIVVRRWMAAAPAADLARLHRLVMLGPPNQGSELARLASRVWVLAALANGAARDLVVDWPSVSRDLAVPACPFGIVAGGKGDDRGFSPLLEGDDDAIVRVDETRLEGADGFLLLPVRHAAMMRNADVQRATVSFLTRGSFTASERDDAAQSPHEGAAATGTPPRTEPR